MLGARRHQRHSRRHGVRLGSVADYNPGIILVTQVEDIGELLRRVKRHLETYPPDVQYNTLPWLDPSASR